MGENVPGTCQIEARCSVYKSDHSKHLYGYCPPRRGRTTFSYMYLLLYLLIFKHRPPSLRPSQYSTASINTPVEIRRRRRKSQTSEKYYQIRCSLILYLYLQIWHNSAVTNSRRFSTARIAHISLRTMYEGSLALPYTDPVRTRPDTPLPRTCRSAVVLFVCPQVDRFASTSTVK